MTITIHSHPNIHGPGLIKWLCNVYQSDQQTAFLQAAHAFPEIPALMLLDILSGRLKGTVAKGGESIEFTWAKPMAEYPAYKMTSKSDGEMRRFVEMVSRLSKDGEKLDPENEGEEPFRMTAEDAIDTVHSLITWARRTIEEYQ